MLLDTHVVLWWIGDRLDRLSPRAREVLALRGPVLTVSAVTIWEAAIKRTLGKLDSPGDLLVRVGQSDARLLPITPHHADHVAGLPLHHGDPFDRLLVAQAQLEGLTIVSADARLARYDVEVLW